MKAQYSGAVKLLLLIISLEALSIKPAAAADIAFVPSGFCMIQLTGDIEEGDSGKLGKILQAKVESGRTEGRHPRLCLNSQGGSYQEAILIIETILSTVHLQTVVDDNAKCYSACALVFLAGFDAIGEGDIAPNRTLHPNGILALHAPYIGADGASNKAEVVARVYRAGVQAVGKLLKVSSKNEQRERLFPRSLLAEALDVGPAEFFYLDTVDKVGRWDIKVHGITQPKQFSSRMVHIACHNYESWRTYRESALVKQFKPGGNDAPATFKAGLYRGTVKEVGAEGLFNCVLDAYRADSADVYFDISIVEPEVDSDPDRTHIKELFLETKAAGESTADVGLQPYFVYLPSTTLKQLPQK